MICFLMASVITYMQRNSIITNINDQIGDDFIKKTKGKHDKRRVVLNFDLLF